MEKSMKKNKSIYVCVYYVYVLCVVSYSVVSNSL